jgi:prolyl-tRNA synthetase
MMGGFGAHEYMAPCPAGENEVALAPGYAANVEVASASRSRSSCPRAAEPGSSRRPGMVTVAAVAGALGVPAGRAAEGLPGDRRRRGLRLVMLRGDHRVNEIKLRNALGRSSGRARPTSSSSASGPAGSSGPSAPTCRSCSTRASRRAAT